jgi:hypothetical protein
MKSIVLTIATLFISVMAIAQAGSVEHKAIEKSILNK